MLAAAAGTKVLGGLAGTLAANNSIDKGMRDYRNNVNKGSDVLRAGQAAANSAYSPFTTAGATGATGLATAITNRQQATQPTLQVSDPTAAMGYIDPSAKYTADQANKAALATGIAGGALGGGMMKALSNNANKMAMTNYNNAYNQMLQSNKQNFDQQQQQYANTTDYDQSQITNYGNMANMGLTANTANQGLQQQYNSGINTNYGAIGASQASGNAAKGGMWNNFANSAGDTISQAIPSMWKIGGK